ncbi:MAG: aminotransferase class III-fold pyridoxal phosphate-dependent enzyme, partial [Bacteroidales bacterium]|nr:aminotransferase class III-fold pyridoxal phosphate-dependent enzyme [Bacteroidales bacterium]
LACAAALAVLDTIEEEHLVDNARETGDYLMERLQALQANQPHIVEVRGRGLMIGLEFNEEIASIRKSLLYDKHIFTGVAGKNMIRLLPPLCLSKAEAGEFITAFKEVLA